MSSDVKQNSAFCEARIPIIQPSCALLLIDSLVHQKPFTRKIAFFSWDRLTVDRTNRIELHAKANSADDMKRKFGERFWKQDLLHSFAHLDPNDYCNVIRQ